MTSFSADSRIPRIAVVMGSRSDYPTMEGAVEILSRFGIPYEEYILSAHRTPERLRDYARSAERRGVRAIIAGAGGAAHLPGMLAAETTLPVFGVPIKSDTKSNDLGGLDALLSIAQMPRGVPVATFSIGGAANAALFVVAVLANNDATLKKSLKRFRVEQTKAVPLTPHDKISVATNGDATAKKILKRFNSVVSNIIRSPQPSRPLGKQRHNTPKVSAKVSSRVSEQISH